jgi:hypothetical protein
MKEFTEMSVFGQVAFGLAPGPVRKGLVGERPRGPGAETPGVGAKLSDAPGLPGGAQPPGVEPPGVGEG